MTGTEFIDQLVRDKAELEALREAKAVEEERAAGRRNRRDRRRAREQVGTKNWQQEVCSRNVVAARCRHSAAHGEHQGLNWPICVISS